MSQCSPGGWVWVTETGEGWTGDSGDSGDYRGKVKTWGGSETEYDGVKLETTIV